MYATNGLGAPGEHGEDDLGVGYPALLGVVPDGVG
jgi:hypothetical protein